MTKFVALYDVHWGYERRGGHKVALHDWKAVEPTLKFMEEFKPDRVILGGDILDCGCISHHNKGKPGATEGLRLLGDARELRSEFIDEVERVSKGPLTYIIGNHEKWLDDMEDEVPSLEGVLSIQSLLKLEKRWTIVPRGDSTRLGKLLFIHGDQLKGGESCAKGAVTAYERNIRFGHFHTYQVYTKTSAVDLNGHTGVAVPCLCKKGPGYSGGAPNKWVQGFCWGWIDEGNGTFNDYVSVIINGRFIANGKEWR